MRSVGKILERAEGVRRAGFGWLASCPLPKHGQGRETETLSLAFAKVTTAPPS